MGDKTLHERMLDVEQCMVALQSLVDVLVKKSEVYDKIIQTKAKQRRTLKKARAAKKRKND